jgi:hypothetical protein
MNNKEAREFLKNQAANVWIAVKELTLEELKEAKSVAEEYSATNCWYVEYNMKDAFIKLIDDRISEIKAQAKEYRRVR